MRVLALATLLAGLAATAHADWAPGGNRIFDEFEVYYPRPVADGHGGAFVSLWWGNTYVHDLDSTGRSVAGWPVLVPPRIGGGGHYFSLPAATISDGAGGVYVVSLVGDSCSAECGGDPARYHLQRIGPGPSLVAGWPGEGVVIGPRELSPGTKSSTDAGPPALVEAPDHGALIAWAEDGEAPGPHAVFAQSVSPLGELRWGGDIPLARGDGIRSPALVSDAHGGALVFWSDPADGLHAQHVSALGEPLWGTSGRIIARHTDRVLAAGDGSGGAIVVWLGTDGGRPNLFAARLNHGGQIVGNAPTIVCVAISTKDELAILALEDGGVLVGWRDWRRVVAGDIDVQRIRRDGAIEWSPEGVALCTAAAYRGSVALAEDGQGGTYVAWEDGRPDGEMFATRVDRDGRIVAGWSADGDVISRHPPLYSPKDEGVGGVGLASLGDGNAMLVWSDSRQVPPYGPDVNVCLAMLLTPTGPVAALPTMPKAQTRDQLTSASAAPALSIREVAPVPATTESRVVFTLPSTAPARIELVDVSGRRVASRPLELSAGEHAIALFDCPTPPGVYFLRLRQGGASVSRPIVVIW